MPSISNPSAAVKIGYNGFALTGMFIQDYKMTPLADMEAVTADGRVLCYVTSNPGRQYDVTLLVNAAVSPNLGNMEPPAKGQTVSLTIGATSGLPVESSGTPAAIEMICMDSSVVRKPGAMLMSLTLNWHPSAAADNAAMDFTGTAWASAS
jgi:hypothetical protein